MAGQAAKVVFDRGSLQHLERAIQSQNAPKASATASENHPASVREAKQHGDRTAAHGGTPLRWTMEKTLEPVRRCAVGDRNERAARGFGASRPRRAARRVSPWCARQVLGPADCSSGLDRVRESSCQRPACRHVDRPRTGGRSRQAEPRVFDLHVARQRLLAACRSSALAAEVLVLYDRKGPRTFPSSSR